MQTLQPLAIFEEVQRSYRRYLLTQFRFRDPKLRESFEQAVNSEDLNQGPFIESLPVFKPGHQTKEVFEQILGQRITDQGFLEAVTGDRTLYTHQEQALLKVANGRNIVVATGTGSGKTESFLFPILLELYREFLANELGPGVRALILYPMNALANDQLERLGDLAERLANRGSRFRFTFGQYIGDTPENQTDAFRKGGGESKKRPGELVTREEMRNAPPHILLTNYSMLEYLLLRPKDSPLFKSARSWKFIVLDEAHQYRGSKGIEIGMLLRRLKQRLKEEGKEGDFCCLATSASLAGDQEDGEKVAAFAANLFGEPFRAEDIIFGERIIPVKPTGAEGPSKKITFNQYLRLAQALREYQSSSDLTFLVRYLAELDNQRLTFEDNLPWTASPAGEKPIAAWLGSILLRDTRNLELFYQLAKEPQPFQKLAQRIFPELPPDDVTVALATLLEVLLQARHPETGAPLISIRYHLFLRSLEGAFLSYLPHKKISLRRQSDGPGPSFETAICQECGQHYLIGRIKGDRLVEANKDPSDDDYGIEYFLPVDEGDGKLDPSNSPEEDLARPLEGSRRGRGRSRFAPEGRFRLCVRCGKVSSGLEEMPSCGHTETIIVERVAMTEDDADSSARCLVCGYHGHDNVREVVHGADGPNVVVATALHRSLPPKKRRVLAFADGRQEAAFFAWYLEKSYQEFMYQHFILEALQRLGPHTDPEGASLKELATALQASFEEAGIITEEQGLLEKKTRVWQEIYRFYLKGSLRNRLQGAGLVKITVKLPSQFDIPHIFLNPPWSFHPAEAKELIATILDTLREDGAFEILADPGVKLTWEELAQEGVQPRVRLGRPGGQAGVKSWEGERGRRADYLAKILVKRGFDPEQASELAKETLSIIWEDLETSLSRGINLLMPVNGGYRLNPNWARVAPLDDNTPLYQCNICGRLHTVSIQGVCSRYRCPGELQLVRPDDLAENHYRELYRQDFPESLRSEEHTAQLAPEKARRFQMEFKEGRIHLLSSSTTFELGVDLGNLDIIFLRNVPPEPFNFAQRAGRAGRRAGEPGLVITFSRRNPHDLYHFRIPQRMIRGQTKPPVLAMRNKKIILRHMLATALAAFFRQYPSRFNNVSSFVVGSVNPRATEDFKEFLLEKEDDLRLSLEKIVPEDMFEAVGLTSKAWIDLVAGPESRLALAEIDFADDCQKLEQLIDDSVGRRDFKWAEWGKKRLNTIQEEDILSWLSRKAVIPKYGFPVDVVELDLQKTKQDEAAGINLERDLGLAIAEYAPGSEVIAAKKVWKSYALKRVAEKEWPRYKYKRCARHNFFSAWQPHEQEPTEQCCSDVTRGDYIIPLFGFVADPKPKLPKSRRVRGLSTRPYFLGPAEERGSSSGISRGYRSGEILSLDGDLEEHPFSDFLTFPKNGEPLLLLRKAAPGRMVILSEGVKGRGFYVCEKCGAGFRRRPAGEHKDALGRPCHGRVMGPVALGHEFETDVVEFRFQPPPDGEMEPVWFSYSLAFAILEGTATVLDVPSSDLNVTVRYEQGEGVSPIILYDNVPGGAGLVAWLEDEKILRSVLDQARERVSLNCCDEQTSCYTCLRSYRNQFAHEHLQRGPVKRYLEKILGQW